MQAPVLPIQVHSLSRAIHSGPKRLRLAVNAGPMAQDPACNSNSQPAPHLRLGAAACYVSTLDGLVLRGVSMVQVQSWKVVPLTTVCTAACAGH